MRTLQTPTLPLKRCVFEHVYFARPDSFVFSGSVDRARRALGRQLAIEQPAPTAELVFAVPDSSNSAAVGFAEQSGLRYELALIRNHYVGRTFIQPSQGDRDAKVKVKYNPVPAGQERRHGRRFHRARHDDKRPGGAGAGRGCAGGAHARVVAAHHRPLLLRHRHAAKGGTDRGEPPLPPQARSTSCTWSRRSRVAPPPRTAGLNRV
jgi:hypothetical protein